MTTAEPTAAYREQLRAPASWYFIGFLFGLALACIFLWFGPWQALAGLVGGTLLSWYAVAAYGRVAIELAGDRLTAGPASLPLSSLGEARALDPARARALQMHEGDPRAFMLLRSYVRTAVRVEVVDPSDPHPYLYLSTRRPEQLAAAFARADAAAS
ncbi:MAG TPA: DUF3093 domain-containing protein [Actinospica sp.]|jgi:hypothetical protein|nr:DUF3093 domain-containing protein [Actinospica sp.]